jgi:hypothetical protein
MTNQEEKNQSPVQTINELLSDQHLTYAASLLIDLHVLAVRTNQNFVLSKRFKKLAYNLANEIAILEPKCVTLDMV